MRYRLEFDGKQHVAVCDCGWRSDPTTSAGLAGSLWDRHREVAHDAT